MISFDPLWQPLKAKGMNKGDLQKLTGLSSTTIAKIGKNERVTLEGGVFLYPKWTNAPGIFVHIMARILR